MLAPGFRPDTMAKEPAAHRMRGLLELLELAARRRHPVTSLARYLEFRADRLAGRVARVDAQAGPSPGELPAAGAVSEFRRRFEVMVVGPRQGVEVPARHASGRVLQRLTLNSFPLPAPAPEPCGWVQLPLPAGRPTLEIFYGEVPRP